MTKSIVILIDTNVWLALAIEKHSFHAACASWLETINQRDCLYFCRATQQSLLRLLTNTTLHKAYQLDTLSNSMAWQVYQQFLDDDRITFQAHEPLRLESHWRAFSSTSKASTKLWMDAYLAAFAVAADDQFVSLDRDFCQFQGLNLCLIPEAESD